MYVRWRALSNKSLFFPPILNKLSACDALLWIIDDTESALTERRIT